MSDEPNNDPIDISQMNHRDVYLTHTAGGFPSILVAPIRLKPQPQLPGWFALYMQDERDLLRFAASCMNKADEISKLREQGILPPLKD